METLLQIGLSNAMAAVVLAVLVLIAGYFGRRPALVHGLWLLVLLKLITPPVAWVPLLPSATPSPVPAAEPSTPLPPVDPGEAARILQFLPPAVVETDPEPAVPAEPADEAAPVPAAVISWQQLALTIWAGGSLVWLLLTGLRIRGFRRLLLQARPAPNELGEQVATLAARLRLGRCPEAWLVPGTLSPMLFALVGRPRLLLPVGLWSRLGDEQRQTLLIHELAHYRRRDHWVRFLELVATGLYWWHPVVWWARHELRAAEEECCDAWVVWALPSAARAYATALMETVDFLAEAQPLCPPAASGIGHLHALKRRLTMIMRGTTPRTLSWTGLLGVLGLGLVLLPWLPTWAQEPARGQDTAPRPPSYDSGQPTGGKPRRLANFHKVFDAKSENCAACHGGSMQASAGTMSLHDDMVRLLGQVERDRQQVQSAEKALQDARQQLKENEQQLRAALDHFRQATATPRPRRVLPPLQRAWANNLFPEHEADAGKVLHGTSVALAFPMANNTGRAVHIEGVRATCGCASVRVSRYDLAPGERGAIKVTVDTARFVGEKSMSIYVMFDKPQQAEASLSIKIDSVTQALPGWPAVTKRPAEDASQRRLEEMQKQLNQLRREIDSMRRKPVGAQSRVPPAPAQPPYVQVPIVPPGKPLVPADPFRDRYYAPTVPLHPEDANQATASKLQKLGEFYERGDHPGQARYFYEMLQKRYPASPEAANVRQKLTTLPAKPADK